MKQTALFFLLFSMFLIGACSSDDASSADGDSPADGDGETATDGDGEAPDGDQPDGDTENGENGEDTDKDEEPVLNLSPTVPERPADPLADSGVTSCPLYRESVCDGGVQKTCAVYDTVEESFVDTPDALLNRVFLYDRWHDLYTSPNGLTAERVFNQDIAGNMPEEEWGAPEKFAGWAGAGDAAIWTGAALVSDIYRYLVTGTDSDYGRMTDRLKALLRDFEVTGIPGYLARHHYLVLDEGGPNSDEIMIEYGLDNRDNRDNPIENPGDIEGLPAMYFDGVPDGQGGAVTGVPYWNGHPSIDQYSGPMTAFPLIFNLLKEEDADLKEKIVTHMTCYLKRLKRLEIINLQENPEALQEITEYFAGANMNLDPDDIDFLDMDTLVVYYLAGFNQANAEDYDRSCPDGIEMEASRIVDAADSGFMLEMLKLSRDLDTDSGKPANPTVIDHFYIANIRGGDASHLMHLAMIAYYLTGEEQYKNFLFDELIGNLRAPEVALTMMAFRLPDFCFRYYGDHITYGTHWQMVSMMEEGALKDTMRRVMKEEIWEKALYNHKSAKFNTMYASVMPENDEYRATAIEQVRAQLRDFGGNDGVMNAPRRTYPLDRGAVIASFPAGTEVRCPTEEERTICEDGGDLFGIPLEQSSISYDCDGRAGECEMADEKCVEGIASDGLPPSLRNYSDFMWQRSPFSIGANHAAQGRKQSPGRDLTEPYWMARYYGYIQEGAGQVLAWKEEGACR